jgi:low affinity Fe/Cu permease
MAMAVSKAAGEPYTFAIVIGGVIVWAASGPIFGFGDT